MPTEPHPMTALSPLLVAALALGAGCGGEPSCPADSRAEGGRCVPVDAGGADSGTEDGGEADSGEVDGGEPDAGPCGGACGGATPVCDASSGSCVECTGDEHCPGERCDTDAGECVACVEDGDCTDPTAARCDPATHACVGCGESADCGHLSGLGVCDGGECVECTDAERSACGAEACKADRTCSDHPHRGQQVCQECDTDANCQEGQLCVELTYANPPPERPVGTYCQWRKDATGPGPNGQCANERLLSQPWYDEETLTSVDGVTAAVCTLRTTTCPAYLQHATAVTGCETPGDDDGACGVPDLNDGRCRYQNPTSMTNPQCTYPCFGDRDCPAPSTCPAAGDRYCSI